MTDDRLTVIAINCNLERVKVEIMTFDLIQARKDHSADYSRDNSAVPTTTEHLLLVLVPCEIWEISLDETTRWTTICVPGQGDGRARNGETSMFDAN